MHVIRIKNVVGLKEERIENKVRLIGKSRACTNRRLVLVIDKATIYLRI